jgi:hypothetical protein
MSVIEISKKLYVEIIENLFLELLPCCQIFGSSFNIVFDSRDNLNRSQNQVVLQ